LGYILSITKNPNPNVVPSAAALDQILAELPAILTVAAAAAIFLLLVAVAVRVMRWAIIRRHPEIDRRGAAEPASSRSG